MADLAAHLARSGVLGPAAAARALAAARDGDVASAALRLGLVREPALARALAEHHAAPAVDLSKSVVPLANLEVLPEDFCRERGVLPVSVSAGEVVLAVEDPDDRRLREEVRLVAGRTVLAYAAVRASIEAVLDALARERSRGASAWRGPRAPALPDPDAAWVGVVHASAPDTAEALGLAPDLAAFGAAAPPPAAAPAGRVAVVADGSAAARARTGAILGRAGFLAMEAADGGTALELVRAARPALAVVDAFVPGAPGVEVCLAVKGSPSLRRTRVVLTSAVHRGPSAADPRAAFGADAFLARPFPDEALLDAARAPAEGGAPGVDGAPASGAAWRDGAALLDAGRVEEATALLREAAARDDLCAEAAYLLGLAAARQGLLFEAASALARAADLRPDVGAAHEALARTREALGLRREARAAWARAVAACPEERRGPLQARLSRLLGA